MPQLDVSYIPTFRHRPSAALWLLHYLLPSAWSLPICGVVVLPLVVLGSFWTSSIFDRPARGFLERYPLVGKIIALCGMVAMAATAISILYRAWANGTVIDKGHVLTFGANPIAFSLWIGGALLLLLLLTAFLGLLVREYREERLADQRVRNRPPLDRAIRQRIDER